ncbi:hypothetical protein [Jiella mangrovi]|uniref:DUF1176 domain-containing protein n=1 Tax=Jiella mangrovi TaxID=2821407 RepID=A0ABS4BM72_9HYPH|nr:hypothetical protein [Jiella mangrovi]MBP0617284.1 hypothetical protein [Jiella mangrovi]
MKVFRALALFSLVAGFAAFSAPALAIDEALPDATPPAEQAAQDLGTAPDDTYLDDRSTPESLIRSLYNAINRHEYLRAWSYFSDESGRPDFAAFQKGYETTGGVKLKLGDPLSEGAAGSIYTSIPTVIESTGTDGAVRVFSGCYVTRFVQPANQATPPFVPLQISKATLRPARTKFDETSGDCPLDGQ